MTSHFDLLIRGGTVVDGTGAAGGTADVAIRRRPDRRSRPARRHAPHGSSTPTASLVTPGFVDIHTHYDAQLHWDPTASPASWHGVTTLLTGNCGFTIAPAESHDVEWLLQMLSRVEGMSADALAEGVRFRGGTIADFLDGLDGRLGVNMGANVGHCAVRRHVMGDDASERTATDDEIRAMQVLVRAAMVDGAMGFTSSQLELHVAHDGRGVPSNYARPRRAGRAGRRPRRVRSRLDRVHPPKLPRRLRRRGSRAHPRHGTGIGTAGASQHAHDHAPCTRRLVAQSRVRRDRRGGRSRPPPDVRHEPPGRPLLPRVDVPVRRDADLPRGAHAPVAGTPGTPARPDRPRPAAHRARGPCGPLVRLRVGGAARRAGGCTRPTSVGSTSRSPRSPDATNADPLDAFLDLSLDEDLETQFVVARPPSPERLEAIARMIRSPVVMAGSSDGGAHLLSFCGADYTTRLLTEWVPSVLTLEQAVARLTAHPGAGHRNPRSGHAHARHGRRRLGDRPSVTRARVRPGTCATSRPTRGGSWSMPPATTPSSSTVSPCTRRERGPARLRDTS